MDWSREDAAGVDDPPNPKPDNSREEEEDVINGSISNEALCATLDDKELAVPTRCIRNDLAALPTNNTDVSPKVKSLLLPPPPPPLPPLAAVTHEDDPCRVNCAVFGRLSAPLEKLKLLPVEPAVSGLSLSLPYPVDDAEELRPSPSR